VSALGLTVAISVSDPPESELVERGLDAPHLRHAFVEVARQILAAGGSLAYGGDLRKGGFTETLAALVRTYSEVAQSRRDRVRFYFAAPNWRDLSDADVAELQNEARIERIGAPEGAPAAVAYTLMRERMSAACDVRLVLGGRLNGQSGRWPGVVEEAYLALRDRRPLFVLGGAGGAADRIAAALRGEWPEELTSEYQRERTPAYAELAESGIGVDEEELVAAFKGADPANGLDAEENAELMATPDLDLMAALTMRGLWTLATG
jgi:hypothetical protein